MRTTIDAAGRIVIPKAIRAGAGLKPGAEVDVELRDGRVEIEAAASPKRLVRQDVGATIEADTQMPPLTSDVVRDVLERVRR